LEIYLNFKNAFILEFFVIQLKQSPPPGDLGGQYTGYRH